jgi:gliding motility-associated-like protein
MFIRFNAGQEYSGNYSIKVTDALGCEDSISVNAQVIPPPTANFPTNNDTIPFEQIYQLEATEGYASYEWNTGDTIYFVTVTTEGDYTVTMKTAEGCEAIESVFMLETYIPIHVPNAFTPNGDGLNDVFRPVMNADQVRQFSMSIYNKWGQLFFETFDYTKGWDGKDAPAGVYSWLISYSDMLGKVSKVKGMVTLIK